MFEDFYLQIEKVDERAIIPTRAHDSDVGIDVFTPYDVTIPANGDVCVKTGLKFKFPKGYGIIFQEKSGRAAKDKLTLGAKVIDPDYRGEVMVNLFNNSNTDKEIKAGTGITQLVVFPIWTGNPQEVQSIENDTERGEGGFGSTDKK